MSEPSYIVGYGIDVLSDGENMREKIIRALEKDGIKIIGCEPLDTKWSLEDYMK